MGYMYQLIEEVLNWWEEHQFDTYSIDGEEYNSFNEEPEFVRLAKELQK